MKFMWSRRALDTDDPVLKNRVYLWRVFLLISVIDFLLFAIAGLSATAFFR